MTPSGNARPNARRCGSLPLAGAALLLAACVPRPVGRPERPSGYRLSLRAVPEDAPAAQASRTRFERREFYYEAVVPGTRAKGGALTTECRLSGRGDNGYAWYQLTHVGEVEFLPAGKKRAFAVATDAGSGLHSVYLSLIDEGSCNASGLTIATPHSATRDQVLERWGPSHAEDERAFLSDMKFRFGYVGKEELDKHADNPKFAYRFWERANGGIVDGPLKLRRYKGRPAEQGSVEAKLEDGRYEFLAEFKAGVVAYDRKSDEHFVLFHPTIVYHWPTVLLRTGDWLVIGTRGEGLAAVDLRRWRLKRVRLGESDDDVKKIEPAAGGVRVNGRALVKL